MNRLLFLVISVISFFSAYSQNTNLPQKFDTQSTFNTRKTDSLTPEKVQVLRAAIAMKKGDSVILAEDAFFDQLKKQPEFQAEYKRILRLRKEECEPVKLNVDYNEDPVLDQSDSRKLSQIILWEEHEFLLPKKLFTILFDKQLFRIISVEDHSKNIIKILNGFTKD